MRYTATYPSPLGAITLASDGTALTGLWFQGQQHYALGLHPQACEASLDVFDATCRWLDDYFRGQQPAFTPPLRLTGTPFRQAVLRALLTIPYGHTATYAQISQRVAQALCRTRMSAQATGGAIAHNPISIIIPCHRVIGADGSLTGYAGGLPRKRALLSLEHPL